MERSCQKRCRKRLILINSDSSSDSEEFKQLKYRKVMQRVMPIKNSPVKKVKILKNIQIGSPATEMFGEKSDSESDEIFSPPIKKCRKIYNPIKQGNELFVSPSTGKQYSVIGNAESQNQEGSCNPIALTPTQKFRESNCCQSRTSSPDLLHVLGETSRCSSLSNISYSNLLPVQLSEENMQELLTTTVLSNTKSKKKIIKNNKYIFKHSFDGEAIENINLDTKHIEHRKCTPEMYINQQEKLKYNRKETKQRKKQLDQYQEQKDEHQEQEKEHQELDKRHQEQEGHMTQEEENQVQEEENQERDEDQREQEEEHQAQEEEHQESEEEQISHDYAKQRAENDKESVNNIQVRNSDAETDNDTDISIESSESSDIEVDEEESENENKLVNENEIVEAEINDNEDDWIDISDEVGIDFDESTLNSDIIPLLRNKSPIDVYNLFLTDEIIDKIVHDTNKFAEKYFEDHSDDIKEKSRLKAWTPTEDQEIRRFFGVMIVMGLNKVPHINDYWSKKSIYRNEYISSVMPRDRFLVILKFLHFCDESVNDTGDKLYKIRQIHNMLNTRFQEVLRPGKIVVIDESMIPWRGRLKFRQYIKNKSHKYGVKLYKLCTPEGYSYNTIIYAGKEGNNREQNHGQNTVLKLIRGLENEGRIVVADNFYSSVGLAEQLLTMKTFYCGTLLSNRKGLPKMFVSNKLKKGQCAGKMKPNGVKVIKWCDKRQVLMITTCKGHNAVLVNTGKKTRVTNEEIQKPSCVLLYNQNKKGIDYSDQMSSYYTSLKRGLKWYRKVMAEFLFGTALVNAWIIYNMSNTNKKMPKKDFTEAIIEALTGRSISEKGLPSGGCSDHALQKGSQRKRCVGCYDKLRLTLNSSQAAKKTKKIVTFCAQCNKSFCLPCFNEKHVN